MKMMEKVKEMTAMKQNIDRYSKNIEKLKVEIESNCYQIQRMKKEESNDMNTFSQYIQKQQEIKQKMDQCLKKLDESKRMSLVAICFTFWRFSNFNRK